MLKSDMDLRKLTMLVTNTTKIHKDTRDGQAALYAACAIQSIWCSSSGDEDHKVR